MPQAFKKCITLTSTLPLEITLWNSIWAIFHICQLLPGNQTAYIIYVVKVGNKMAKSLTLPKSAQYFFPGKNRIRKIREKSGYQILVILDQISRMDTKNYCFLMQWKFFLVIYTNSNISDVKIFGLICTNSEKTN